MWVNLTLVRGYNIPELFTMLLSFCMSGLVVVKCGRVSELSATDTDRKLIWKSSVKFRSAKVALYMKAACLVFSFYSFLKSSEILHVLFDSVLFAAVSEVLDDFGFTYLWFTYWKVELHRERKQS